MYCPNCLAELTCLRCSKCGWTSVVPPKREPKSVIVVCKNTLKGKQWRQ